MSALPRPAGTLIAAVLSLCLLCVSPALAAPTFLTPEHLSASASTVDDPQIAVSPGGDATAVWTRVTAGNEYVIEAATRPAGGTWSAAEQLSDLAHDADSPQVAVDAAGNATAVWESSTGIAAVVRTAIRTAGGSWTPPEDLATNARDPQIAVDPVGNVTAVWIDESGTPVVKSATRTGGLWGAPSVLSDAAHSASSPDVAVDSAGNATAVWRLTVVGDDLAKAATRPAGGAWSPATQLSKPGASAINVTVAVDAAGNATALWRRIDDTTGRFVAQTSTRPAGGSWPATPDDLSDKNSDALSVEIAAGPAGVAVALWRLDAPSTRSQTLVQSTTRTTIGGAWSTPVTLSNPAVRAYGPQIAVNPAGDAIAVWRQRDTGFNSVRAATRPAGGVWSTAPTAVSGSDQGDEAQVGIDDAGNAAIAWHAADADFLESARAAGFDAAGPSFSGQGSLSVPSLGAIGVPVLMAASPFDVWSTVTTSWNFGDGGTATGGSVPHTYAAPGTYTVTVTATDAVGNATTATRSITIPAAAFVPPAFDPPLILPPAPQPQPEPATPELLLEDRKLTVDAVFKRSKKTKRCPKRAQIKVRLKVSGVSNKTKRKLTLRSKKTKLKARTVTIDGAERCEITGTLRLKRTPPSKAKIRLKISAKAKGRRIITRTLTARR